MISPPLCNLHYLGALLSSKGTTLTMDGNEAEDDEIPHYPGDDPRPTSKKELAGWYCYGWAAEVFTVCAMGTYAI